MKDKRGTHVGVIISFLIFITFIVFLFSITQPVTKVKRDKLDLLEYLKVELLNKFSDDLTKVVVSFTEGRLATCVKFKLFDEELQGLEAVVKRVDANEIETSIKSSVDDKKNTIIHTGETTSKKLNFYYSLWFISEAQAPCSTPEEREYKIELYRTTKNIFENKIINIGNEIKSSSEYYEELKDELGIGLDDNFGFNLTDCNKNSIAGTIEPDISIDIYSEEIPIQYIDSEANIKPGFLTIRVW